MQTVTVRQLRHDFGSVMQIIEAGEEVDLLKRGKVIARISPPKRPRRKKIEWPDFEARLKRIYGDKVLPDSQPFWDEERADR